MKKLIFLVFMILTISHNLFAQNQRTIDSIALRSIDAADSLRSEHRDYQTAIVVLNEVLYSEKSSLVSDSAKSKIYHNLGIYKYLKRNYAQSVNALDTAILLKEKYDELRKDEIAYSFFLRGLAKKKLNFFELASTDFKQAIDLLENYPEDFDPSAYKKRLFEYYTQMGIVYRNLNENLEALNYYNAAERYVEYGGSEVAKARFYSAYGIVFSEIADFESAFKSFNVALDIYNKIGSDSNLRRVLDTEKNIASVYVKMENFEKAKNKYLSILKVIESNRDRYSDTDFLNEIGSVSRNLAFTERELGNYQTAREHYTKALELSISKNLSNNRTILSLGYEGLADVDLAEKKWDDATANYQKSIINLCNNFNPANEFTLPIISKASIVDKKSLKRVLSLKANGLRAKYKATKDEQTLFATYQTYQTLDSLITQIRRSYDSDLSRYDIIQGTIPIYENAATVALQLYQIKQDEKYLHAAFDFSSKNKAIVLLEDQKEAEAKFAGIPTDLLAQEKELKKEFYSLEQEIFKLENDPKKNKAILDSIKQVRFQSSRNYEKLIANFEKNYPEYHRLKYANRQTISLKQLQAALPPQTAMLEYFVGLDNILTFVLTANELKFHQQDKPANFDELCQSYRQIAEGKAVSLADFAQKSTDLFDLLLQKPLQDLQSEKINRLFIIPDDYLHEISFDAFFTQALTEQQISAGWGVKGLPILLRKYAISYAYSNRLLHDYHQDLNRKRGNKKLFAGFGLDYRDETYADIADDSNLLASRSARDKIRPLPFAVEEIDIISEQLNGDVWLNEEASKANFMAHAADYKILHLAMHGLVEKKQPLNSALIFNKEQEEKDYLLTAGDLYSSTLAADMVVLSACDTGAGQLQKGEGAMTLARAFNYAGCPSLVASLWSAADEPTKDLMVGFYKHLQEGHPKDVAMQMAKLDHLDQGLSPSEAPPHFWSHLVIIGDTSTIEFSSGFPKFWIIGLVVGLLLFGAWKLFRK